MTATRRTAIVTGAAGGLGLAIAERLAKDSLDVALIDIDSAGAEAAADRIEGARGYGCDVTDEGAVVELLDRFESDFGSCPDVLVNNAGIVRFGDLLEHSAKDFRKVLDVNLVGTFIMAQQVGRRMAGRGSGAIVNITSLNAFATSPDAGAYPASKAAVAKLTEQFALTLAPLGVRVNAVAPGFIDSGMSSPIYEDPEVRAFRGASVPAGRIGEAVDVANAVAFLASEQAAYIHGQHLLIDGGVGISLKKQMPRKAPTRAEK
ncbi:SDR family NAD(P)-dependent oxidoreductase [Oceanibacterium hippocampi]|uniref:3-oxoacyl-[acyl-carrier-protein] reductase FabG n=1 Tax=Oceanibacterium hippocampi TaxID=745714 RepID=A0A1Y5TTR3_9PROT|nr:SDR family NAD(P)-dependent oxidoreductase [Oceanibacterium hippocampi]SLN72115.1 3-oxoacyl-[acyl-carrier-protein] reductase FabG [Oceanibacterium hippocampi]